MAVAALIAWAITVAGGLILLTTWFGRGGPEQHRRGTSRLSPRLTLSHGGLAATGLAIWIVAVATDVEWLRWVCVALLPVVAALGLVMFLRWLGGRGAHPGHETDRPAEQHFPLVVVALHGVLAIVTVVLAVLAAAGLGS